MCPSGFYSNTTASSTCFPCSTCHPQATMTQSCSQPSISNRVICACNSGYEGDGTFSCTPCWPGFYKSSASTSLCLYCPKDTYASQTGSTRCLPCTTCSPYATYNRSCTLGAASDLTICQCNAGYTGPTSGTTCTACPTGTYKSILGSSPCIPCTTCSIPSQTTITPCLPASTNDSVQCPCSAGYYYYSALLSCLACPSGTFTNTTNLTTCTTCPTDTFANQSSLTTCTTCPSGHYQTSLGSTFCKSKSWYLQVHTIFPPGTPVNQLILKRIHCSPIWQKVQIIVQLHRDDYLPIPLSPFTNLTFQISPLNTAKITPYNEESSYLQGLSPGTATFKVTYSNLDYTSAPITISNDSIYFTALAWETPVPTWSLHTYPGGHVSIPTDSLTGILSNDPATTLTLLADLDTPWDIIFIQTYPSHILSIAPNLTLTIWRNTWQQEILTLSLPQCPSSSQLLTVTTNITTNLIPYPFDLDIGLSSPSQLAILPYTTNVPLYLSALNVTAFLITIALDWPVTACIPTTTIFTACTINDPPGYITLAGVSAIPITDPRYLLANLTTDHTMTGLQANLTILLSNSTMIHLTTQAAYWRTPLTPLWAKDKQTIVDLPLAYTSLISGNTLLSQHIILVLTQKTLLIQDIILYSTHFELSILLRFQDLYGSLISSNMQCTLFISSSPPLPPSFNLTLPNHSISALLHQDSWWGVQYRQDIPTSTFITTRILLTTFNTLGSTDPSRTYLYTTEYILTTLTTQKRRSSISIPPQLTLGQPFYQCPRLAHYPGYVLVHFTSTLPIQDPISLACSTSVPMSRLTITTLIPNKLYTLTFIVESLLRAYDLRIFFSNSTSISYHYQSYEYYPPDPYTPCPSSYYFSQTTGTYQYLPPHASPGPLDNCYGFTCPESYTKTPLNTCSPASTSWFWTIVILTLFLVILWATCITVITVFTRTFFKVTHPPVLSHSSGNSIQSHTAWVWVISVFILLVIIIGSFVIDFTPTPLSSTSWFWTIVILTLFLVILWATCITVITVFTRTFFKVTHPPEPTPSTEFIPPEPIPNPFFDPTGVLPISATQHGELEYEIEELVSSTTSSDQDSEDIQDIQDNQDNQVLLLPPSIDIIQQPPSSTVIISPEDNLEKPT